MVRDARLLATVNHGNLVLLGTEYWGDVRGLSVKPTLSAAQALDAGFAYADGRAPEDVIVARRGWRSCPFAPQEFQDGEGFGGPDRPGLRPPCWSWSFVFQRRAGGSALGGAGGRARRRGARVPGHEPVREEDDQGRRVPAHQHGGLPEPGPVRDHAAQLADAVRGHGLRGSATTSPTATASTTTPRARRRRRSPAGTSTSPTPAATSATARPTGNINLGGAQRRSTTAPRAAARRATRPASRSAFYELNRIARAWRAATCPPTPG